MTQDGNQLWNRPFNRGWKESSMFIHFSSVLTRIAAVLGMYSSPKDVSRGEGRGGELQRDIPALLPNPPNRAIRDPALVQYWWVPQRVGDASGFPGQANPALGCVLSKSVVYNWDFELEETGEPYGAIKYISYGSSRPLSLAASGSNLKAVLCAQLREIFDRGFTETDEKTSRTIPYGISTDLTRLLDLTKPANAARSPHPRLCFAERCHPVPRGPKISRSYAAKSPAESEEDPILPNISFPRTCHHQNPRSQSRTPHTFAMTSTVTFQVEFGMKTSEGALTDGCVTRPGLMRESGIELIGSEFRIQFVRVWVSKAWFRWEIRNNSSGPRPSRLDFCKIFGQEWTRNEDVLTSQELKRMAKLMYKDRDDTTVPLPLERSASAISVGPREVPKPEPEENRTE
ncbi:hypothetical protein K474DRAFT_1680922 [Panus rudis PR-1116 ss-1]|nr:hypothetical protein K474DRAFT_1680922 [Panus rudis PR-1116 ss-1]